jgi:chromate transporter
MNPILVYLLLLKATATSFTGLASLPMVRNDFVVNRRVLTDRQLAAAVAAGQTAPGPVGLYVVSVGYFVGGVPGACAGCLALMTPAFLILPMLRYVASRSDSPRLRGAVQSLTLAAAGLIVSAAIPLARHATSGALNVAIALAAFVFLVLTRRDTLWVIAGSAAIGLLTACAPFSRL